MEIQQVNEETQTQAIVETQQTQAIVETPQDRVTKNPRKVTAGTKGALARKA